ncbi:MAG: alpha/beta hydrolase [Clostridia bacterium]|nr:alpha/beta hydrolase [Clostridia bacterium]
MNPEAEQRGKYRPDYTGMELTEMPFCEMTDFEGIRHIYKLDLLVKENDTNPRKPAVIFVHGGGFLEPNDRKQAYISLFARDLTNASYAVVSPDYPQFADEEKLNDAGGEPAAYEKAGEAVHRAYRYLRSNAGILGIDPNRISIMGGSAGSMAAFYAIGRYTDTYRAFINCWGPPLVLPDMRFFPPTLSIHGDADPLVSCDREVPVQNALEKAGVPHKLIILSGQPHTPLGKYREFLPEILEWIGRGCREN